jgi:predicted TIM-barrel fold metal-dependent hydrolase
MIAVAAAVPWAGVGVLDAWVNTVPPSVAEAWRTHPDSASVLRQFHRTSAGWGETTVELIARMDRLGIARGLLSSIPGVLDRGGFDGEARILLDVIEAHPDRFRGLPFVDPRDPMQAARDLRRGVEEHGFVGARVFPAAIGLPPNDRRFYPTFTTACELGVPVTVNVGIPGPLYPADPARPLHLDDVCRDFPELVVVTTHMGHPWEGELVALMAKYPNLRLMTSAWAPRYYAPEVLRFLRSRGRRQVMFASDHPLVPLDRAIAELADFDLPADVWPAFLRDNAARVFWGEDV